MRFDLHGMVWESEVDLHHRTARGDARADLILTLGERLLVDDTAPPGEVLAHLSQPDGVPMYTFTRSGTGVCLRFHRLCEFALDPSLSTAVCHLAPGTDIGYVQVLATGMLASTVLHLRHHPVLHASAVELDGAAIALTAASGMGKSTLARLLCATGGRLISDDVLRVDALGDGPATCYAGSSETRLREKAEYLVTQHDQARTTADGRRAVSSEVSDDRVPLRALVVPYPTRELTTIDLTRLSPQQAVTELMRFPRIVGWRDPSTTAELFQHLVRLVRAVPVLRAAVPWRDELTAADGWALRSGVDTALLL